MTVTEKVYAILSADAGVTALCPASNIKPSGADIQAMGVPCVVHFPVSLETTQTHSQGLARLKKWVYEVSCFVASPSQGEALSGAVIAALGSCQASNFNSTLSGRSYRDYDANVRVEQISLEFEIWESL